MHDRSEFGAKAKRLGHVAAIVVFLVFGFLLVGSVANRGWTMLEKAASCQKTP